MTLVIHPRSEIGIPEPVGRARLAPKRKHLVHYTGSTGYADLTKHSDHDWAAKIAAYGASDGKVYEYNEIICPGGTIYLQAGAYVSANCLHFNPDSYATLLIIGIDTPALPQPMIDAFVERRAQLLTGGIVDSSDPSPHYMYRSTSCPGPLIATAPGAAWHSPTGEGRLGQLVPALLATWTEPNKPQIPLPPTPPQIITGDPAMFQVNTTGDANGLGIFVLDANGLHHLNPDAATVLDGKLPVLTADKAGMRGLFGAYDQPVPAEFD